MIGVSYTILGMNDEHAGLSHSPSNLCSPFPSTTEITPIIHHAVMASELSTMCEKRDNTFGPHAGDCRGRFDFTLMFEEVVLTILPVLIILICALFRIFYLSKKRTKVERGWLLFAKLASYTAYEIITLCLVVIWAEPGASKTSASIPTAVLTLITFLILPVLSYVEHAKSVRPSLLLNMYLLISVVFDAARTRTLWLRSQDKIASNFTIALALKIVILILETIEKRRILKHEYRWFPTEATSGLYNTCLFLWLNELLQRGARQTMSLDDLFALDKQLISTNLHNLLERSWMKVKAPCPHTLFWTTSRALRWPLLAGVLPRIGLTGFNFCQPFLLQRAIEFSQEPVTVISTNTGYALIGAYFLVYTGIAITTGRFQHLTYRVITMVRGGLISLLYGKATELSIAAADTSSSMILMSADIERITTGWQTIHELWANIIEVGLAIYLLERQLGVACAIPIGVATVSMAGSLVATSLVMSRQAMWLEAIERRIAATTEMLGSMKGVKMCGLTDVISLSLQDLRLEELRISRRFRKLLIWNMGFTYITPICAPILTFTVYSVIARSQGNSATLDTARIFTSLSLFTLLADPLQSLIMSMATFAGSIGSFRRIQDFLTVPPREDGRKLGNYHNSPRRESDASTEVISAPPDLADDIENEKSLARPLADDVQFSSGDGILVLDAAFGWDTDKPATLRSITFRIPRDSISIIMGPVGCGKSTLLKGILGEASLLAGSVHLPFSDIAFCDQTPWHMNGTIQESILGISKMEEIWYSTVTRACALDEDFSQLWRGDQTSIGSNGISLSGGQSQRIALARAIYARKSIVVLDDVLGGLDVDTENRVFHNLFGRNGLLRKHNVTTLITSSSAKRLPYSDHVIILSGDGRVAEQGNFKKLSSSGCHVSSFRLPPPDWNYESQRRSNGFLERQLTDKALSKSQSPPEKSNRQMGDVAVYYYYVKAVGWIPTLIFISAISAFVFCLSFPTIWIKWWAASNLEAPNQTLGYYLGIYALLGVLALLSLIGSCWQLVITMIPRSGESFHKILLKTVLSAPMSFFNSTDTGVTINRFSQDLMLIDMELPLTALNTVATFILCIAQMVLIGVASTYSAISFPIVLVALYFIQKFYLRTSRQLRLLDLEAKSPLYSQFMECISGLATIRAFGWQHALEEQHAALLDQSQKPFYLLFAVQRWLTLVLDLIVAAIAVILVSLVVKLRGTMDPGFVGVALLNVILFSQSIKMLLNFWTNLETHIGSISRIKSFTGDTEVENLPNENALPLPEWPVNGAVEFKNVSAEYRIGEPVIKNVTLSIEGGEKIGICGRTGSGKTSFVLCIFRMIEMSSGNITIDGLDISTVPRQEVRSKIIGVPQDAYLFTGSVRLNADPLRVQEDSSIIDALKTVRLWDKVKEKNGLDTDIEQVFLSHGQKQLFCLARAMLRKSTILVLDEATSSVDAKTDELMQRIIRQRFASHTIIAVAHKLDTILDFDKVLLLDEGQLVEFDSPYELLSDESSAFHKLYYGSHAEEDGLDDHTTQSDDGT